MEIPKGDIEFFVARLHVSETDEAVRAEILRRIGPVDQAITRGWSEATIQQACDYAVQAHHNNQNLYSYVMGGSRPRRSRKKGNA
jgi:hypothetical protein